MSCGVGSLSAQSPQGGSSSSRPTRIGYLDTISAVSTVDAPSLSPASLADGIADRLQRDILEGRIGLGDHLTQDELCARFGVSRTPIREALMKLEASHLVQLRPNRGAVVRTPGRREVQEVYELRAELEGFAAERAASRIDRVRLRRLDRLQEDLSETVQHGPTQAADDDEMIFSTEIGAANDAFHNLILEVADNDTLQQDVGRLRGRFPKDYVTDAAGSVNDLRALNVTEHDAIRASLATGDGSAARRAMTGHVAHAGHLLIEHLDRQRFWG
jgi:DNA-binding GntR family transcriptional regulator